MKHGLLREWIIELLREQEDSLVQKLEKKVEKLGESKVGLIISSNSQGTGISLYDTGKFVKGVVERSKNIKSKMFASTFEEEVMAKLDGDNNPVLGNLTLKFGDNPCNGAMVVDAVFSDSGYGPILYDIGMAISPSGIYADRGSISNQAMGLWTNYSSSRSDVKKKEFDDVSLPPQQRKTPDDPSDDCEVWGSPREFLDFSYKKGSNLNVQQLEKNHQTVVNNITSLFPGVKENIQVLIENVLGALADSKFGSEYDKLDFKNIARKLKK